MYSGIKANPQEDRGNSQSLGSGCQSAGSGLWFGGENRSSCICVIFLLGIFQIQILQKHKAIVTTSMFFFSLPFCLPYFLQFLPFSPSLFSLLFQTGISSSMTQGEFLLWLVQASNAKATEFHSHF